MKINANGTVLNLGDAIISPTFVAIAQVETFDGPEISRGLTDVPTHDDSGAIRRLADALFSLGPVTFSILYDPVGGTHDAATGLAGLAESGEIRPFNFIFPDAASTQWDFDAVVNSFKPTGMDANSGQLKADVTVTPDGNNVTIA